MLDALTLAAHAVANTRIDIRLKVDLLASGLGATQGK